MLCTIAYIFVHTQLTVSSGDFFGNHKRLFELIGHVDAKHLLNGVDKTEWPVAIAKPTDANAFYQQNLNEICECNVHII